MRNFWSREGETKQVLTTLEYPVPLFGENLGVIELNKDIFGFKNQFEGLMDRGELKMLEHHTSISISGVKS